MWTSSGILLVLLLECLNVLFKDPGLLLFCVLQTSKRSFTEVMLHSTCSSHWSVKAYSTAENHCRDFF